MTLKPPPPLPDHGELCTICYPGVARTNNTLCEPCLRREIARPVDETVSVEFSYTPTVQHAIEATIPRRYHSAEDAHLLPLLRHANVLHDGVLLWGAAGRGKTHQAAILVRQAIVESSRSGMLVPAMFQWHSAAGLFERIRCEQRQTTEARRTIEKLVEARVLVIDDLGAERPTDWVRERLYEIVNARYEAVRPIVVTTNLSPALMEKQLGARITSRLVEMCRVEEVSGEQRRQPQPGEAA